MPLSEIEREELMQNLDIEIGNMFDRLLNQYSGREKVEHARLLLELEKHIRDGLFDRPNPVTSYVG